MPLKQPEQSVDKHFYFMPDQQLLAGSVTDNEGISKFSLVLEG